MHTSDTLLNWRAAKSSSAPCEAAPEPSTTPTSTTATRTATTTSSSASSRLNRTDLNVVGMELASSDCSSTSIIEIDEPSMLQDQTMANQTLLSCSMAPVSHNDTLVVGIAHHLKMSLYSFVFIFVIL